MPDGKRPEEDRDELESERELEEALAQRPAAFRFAIRGGKIDALPEKADILDLEAAKDLYAELKAKAQTLQDRLARTNSDKRAQDSVTRLIESLDAGIHEVRPGLLLSRSRSIEADRAAFNTRKARQELFPDAIAMMDDVLMSARDVMTVFPIVREIEAEQLALEVQRDGHAIQTIQRHTNTIKGVAATSDEVTAAAAAALKAQDADIATARTPVVRARLVADQLLVVRNFVGEVVRIVRTGAKRAATSPALQRAGSEFNDGLSQGSKLTGGMLPVVGAGLLIGLIDPVAGLAAFVGGFKLLGKVLGKSAPGKPSKKPSTKTGNRVKKTNDAQT